MVASIAGMVFRAANRHETARFYAELGLGVYEHQHGGPLHYEVAPMSDEIVLEIYLRSPVFARDALMINVDSIEVALEVASRFQIEAKMPVRDTEDSKFVYINDPDGRDVLLIQKK